jgi:hypothetical protein
MFVILFVDDLGCVSKIIRGNRGNRGNRGKIAAIDFRGSKIFAAIAAIARNCNIPVFAAIAAKKQSRHHKAVSTCTKVSLHGCRPPEIYSPHDFNPQSALPQS